MFAAIPFWHLRPFGPVSVYEMAMIVNLLFFPLYLGRSNIRWGGVDVLVFLFALSGILTVAISSASIYESMRIYRYMVLAPVLLYFVMRVMRPTQRQLIVGMITFSASVTVQALVVIYYVVQFGERPAGDSWAAYPYQSVVAGIVTFSVLAAMAASACLFLVPRFKGIRRYGMLVLGLVCVAGLLASATRASALAFLFLFPLSGWFLRRGSRRKWLVAGGYLVLATVIVAVAQAVFFGMSVSLGGGGEERRAIERVIDIDEYKADISGRVAFWANLTREAFSSPVFGKGMASYDVGFGGGTSFHVGSAHNMLVSAFYTSGIIGLCLLMLLWHSAFQRLNHLRVEKPDEAWISRFLAMSVMVLLLVSVTNDLTAGRGNLLMFLLALLYQGAQAPALSRRVGAAIDEPVSHSDEIKRGGGRILQAKKSDVRT